MDGELMTSVTLTGTGTPTPRPDRAGAGVLVDSGGLYLQLDAGRATAMRLARLRVTAGMLDAVFLTHHHSDHLQGLDDLAFSRWVNAVLEAEPPEHIPLPLVAPDGPLRPLLESLLDPWESDFQVRRQDMDTEFSPALEPTFFRPQDEPHVVWQRGSLSVTAAVVRHAPVVPAIAYRVDSEDGSVVFSGDTKPCEEMRRLSAGADVLVHEAMLSDALLGTPRERVMHYHSDSEAVGAIAAGAGVTTLMLTHLIPPPEVIDDGVRRYEESVRRGGFEGELVVGEDGSSITRGARR